MNDGVESLKTKHDHPVSHTLDLLISALFHGILTFVIRTRKKVGSISDHSSAKIFTNFVRRAINFPLKITKMDHDLRVCLINLSTYIHLHHHQL